MDLAQFALKIGVALGLGMVIGLERQLRQHTAGLRTNTLVCLGAALFVSLSYSVGTNIDPTRVAGQVVTGIGFLGGGVIFKEGLERARAGHGRARSGSAAAVGVLAGAGLLLEASIGTAAVLFVHLALRPLVYLLDKQTKMTAEIETSYRMTVECSCEQSALIRAMFIAEGEFARQHDRPRHPQRGHRPF